MGIEEGNGNDGQHLALTSDDLKVTEIVSLGQFSFDMLSVLLDETLLFMVGFDDLFCTRNPDVKDTTEDDDCNQIRKYE